MVIRLLTLVIIVLLGGALSGCQLLARVYRPADITDRRPEKIEPGFNPAGAWIYEERGMRFSLELDEQGNGAYEWKDGFFLTTSVTQRRWRGTWHQPGNDREGGFEVQLVDDRESAKGHWWYTRIGDDRSPQRPGGTFTLSRNPTGVKP